MSEIIRVPACPDCGELGIPVRGDWFRCSNSDCRAIWKEKDWTKRIAKEKARREAEAKAPKVSSLLSVGEIKCDACDEIIRHGDRYCYKYSAGEKASGGMRYCANCSYAAGWLQWVREKVFNRIVLVMFVTETDKLLDISEVPPEVIRKYRLFLYGSCPSCKRPLVKRTPFLTCGNPACNLYRGLLGFLDKEKVVMLPMRCGCGFMTDSYQEIVEHMQSCSGARSL